MSPLIPPSPKLKLTLLIVPSASDPLTVKVIEKGAVPVVALSTARLLQIGAWFVEGVPPVVVGVGVRVGVSVTPGAVVGVSVGVPVGVSVTMGVGVEVPVGMGMRVSVGPVGVIVLDPITIVAGTDVDRTFSLA